MMDYEIGRCTRHCAVSGRELKPGEEFYSALVDQGAGSSRMDYAREVWEGPPPGAVGWWKSHIPDPNSQKLTWAPNDVMLDFFDELAEQPDRQDVRYVLALLLVRRRVMRLEESQTDTEHGEVIVLYCPRRDATYHVPAREPTPERIDEIQQHLSHLLEG